MNNPRLIFHSRQGLLEYRRLVKKWTSFVKRKNQLKFLRRCQEEQVIPKTYGKICEPSFTGEAFSEYQKAFLKDKISETTWEVEAAHMELRQQMNVLRDYLEPDMFEVAKQKAGEVAHSRGVVHFNNLNNKLSRLFSISRWTWVGENCQVINLSSIEIDRNKLELLGLGLNFSVGTDKQDIVAGISNINNFNFRHDYKVSFLKGLIVDNIFSDNISSLPLRHRSALKSLKDNKDIKVLKADKGGSTVIMDLCDYNIKAYRLLGDTDTYIKLPNLPTVTSVQSEFNRQVTKIANSLRDNEQKNIILSKISKKVPSLPYFYGIPKVHKRGCPLRPIVATCNSPQSVLAEWLAKQLSPYLGKFSDAHLLHSSDFIDRLRQLGQIEGKMISLDVTALFTNVPLDYVLTKLRLKYEEGLVDFSIPIDAFLDLIKLCVSSTVFSFNGEGFKQKFGVAMGSPLSPILANLCMEFVEKDILDYCPPHLKPLIWVRYVDDIFIVFKGTPEEFNNFFEYVNSFVPSIKFTAEHESENKLPFLDVMVFHDPIVHSFKFSVFRKETNAENYIHFFSFHSNQIKTNIIMNFVLRAYKVCDPEFIDGELSHIRNVFNKLCYPSYFIDKAFSKAKKKIYNPPSHNMNRENKNNNFLSIPYHPKLLEISQKINRSSNGNVNIVFNYNNTVRKMLVHNKTPDNNNKDVGVYEIPCKDCNEKYFGESGRGLKVRTEEHRKAYDRFQQNNALVKHSWDKDHRIDWDRAKLLYKSSNVGNRRLIEGACINMGFSMEGNKSFTQEDSFIDNVICQTFLTNFTFKYNPPCTTPNTVAALPSFAQVEDVQNDVPVTDTQAGENLMPENGLRRSRRLAGLPMENTGIT